MQFLQIVAVRTGQQVQPGQLKSCGDQNEVSWIYRLEIIEPARSSKSCLRVNEINAQHLGWQAVDEQEEALVDQSAALSVCQVQVVEQPVERQVGQFVHFDALGASFEIA